MLLDEILDELCMVCFTVRGATNSSQDGFPPRKFVGFIAPCFRHGVVPCIILRVWAKYNTWQQGNSPLLLGS